MEPIVQQPSHKLYLLLLALIFSGLLYLLAPILTPFLIGALLAYLIDPLVTQLTKLHISRLTSIIIIFSLSFLVMGLLVIFLIPVIQTQIENLYETIPNIIAWVQDTLIPWISNQLGIHEANVGTIKSTIVEHLAKTSDSAGKFINTIVHSGFVLAEWLIKLILIPVVMFYLLIDKNTIIKKTRNLLPRRIEPTVVKITKECNSVLSAFFRGQLLVMLSISIYYSIGLTLLGLRIGLILGLIIGTISIVPYLGVIVGVIAASIAAFVQFDSFTPVLLVWLLFIVGHSLDHMFLTPKLIGDRIGLHPIAVIFAVLAGGKLFGFFGILLALPAAAVIMVWLRFLVKHYHGSRLYQ
jgi:predicted PurR-regulated permease PerM